MKKIVALLLAIAMLCSMTVFALAEAVEAPAERNYAPEAGTGWMIVDICGETQELAFVEAVRGLTGVTYVFENNAYSISIVLDRKLKVGETMGENAINSIEVLSHTSKTSGYYFTKKSSSVKVNSEVTMAKIDEDGLYQGTFKVDVTTADRWLGDAKPGILPVLNLTNGEFCFHK